MDQQQIVFNNSSSLSGSDVFEPTSIYINAGVQRPFLVDWLNYVVEDLNFSRNASDEDLRKLLVDGYVLCRLIKNLKPASAIKFDSSLSNSENVQSFLSEMEKMGLPTFQLADLEKGSMKAVLDCLLTLQTQFMPNFGGHDRSYPTPNRKMLRERILTNTSSSPPFADEKKKSLNKSHEAFQLKQRVLKDLSPSKVSEIRKANSIDNAPVQSLISVINGILDDSIQRRKEEIPPRVAFLLRKVVQEIERRISTHAQNLRTQYNIYKAQEEEYQSRIRTLEGLPTETTEDTKVQTVTNQQQEIKKKNKTEEEKKVGEDDNCNKKVQALKTEIKDEHNQEIQALKQDKEHIHNQDIQVLKQEIKEDHNQEIKASKQDKELGDNNQEIEALKKEIEALKKDKENGQNQEIQALKQEIKALKQDKEHGDNQEIEALKQEIKALRQDKEQGHNQEIQDSKQVIKDNHNEETSALKQEREREHNEKIKALKQEMETAKRTYEQKSSKMEEEAKQAQQQLEGKLMEVVNLLTDSRNKVKELEMSSQSISEKWKKKDHIYHIFTEFQLGALKELRFASQSIRKEIVRTQESYSEDFIKIGSRIGELDEAAKNYASLLAENRKMHNELQELKGNIRVYCRVRPFLPGQKGKQSIIDHVGENGELIVSNPTKTGKEGRRSFKFNIVYGPITTQAQVYKDTQPLIQSVLDGYNVCIFAYGQSGSGKTYTMTGPDNASEEDWGVNYRALNDLFRISQSRKSNYTYEITVQMIEIYNEQVRDLLSNDAAKKLGIMSTTQPSGLAVPDASIEAVNSIADVLKVMDTGQKNRAKSSTALNARSSRSHSIVSIHVQGLDIKSNSSLRGSLHLVDLAGSERVDRSEVTGERLKEAQNINKSLSALGDVIFALAQKSTHIPYRNSKLTQVLQSSLGGQAKTLMFVQLNPDADSFSETLSTLKFAERVSGVELGAAKSSKDSSKEGRDVKELMEQVASLKDSIAKKDEQLESLQLIKDLKKVPSPRS